jgi:TRAF-type zinc finger.
MLKKIDIDHEDLACVICSNILYHSKKTVVIECEHYLCKKCYDSLNSSSLEKRCPVCCSDSLKKADTKTRSKIISDINNKIIQCPICSIKFSFKNFKSHETRCIESSKKCNYCQKLKNLTLFRDHILACRDEIIDCSNSCGVRDKRKNLSNHYLKCPNELITCTNGCDIKFERRLKDDHNNYCNEFNITCPNDCKAVFPRKNLANHFNDCGEVYVLCKYSFSLKCIHQDKQNKMDAHEKSHFSNDKKFKPGNLNFKLDSYPLGSYWDVLDREGIWNVGRIISIRDNSITNNKEYLIDFIYKTDKQNNEWISLTDKLVNYSTITRHGIYPGLDITFYRNIDYDIKYDGTIKTLFDDKMIVTSERKDYTLKINTWNNLYEKKNYLEHLDTTTVNSKNAIMSTGSIISYYLFGSWVTVKVLNNIESKCDCVIITSKSDLEKTQSDLSIDKRSIWSYIRLLNTQNVFVENFNDPIEYSDDDD